MKIKKYIFGKGRRGEKILLYTLKNDNGITVKITNYGGIITAIETPDKEGRKVNIALGFKSFSDYISNSYIDHCPCFGCITGRYANRIAKGKFTLDKKTYTLALNNGNNCLHGGITGFDKVIWVPKEISKLNQVGVELKYRSVHMEEGFPGNLDLTVTYQLNNKNELSIDYKATTDQKTVINLTNHTYLNLAGNGTNILAHSLYIAAQTKTVNNEELIPTGEFSKVSGTPFDFTSPTLVGARINDLPDGYDCNFVLENPNQKLVQAAILTEEKSGRKVEVFTTEPGIQLYTGYHIPNIKGQGGEKFGKYAGLALETQHYPDSPNHPSFPTTTLNSGETFKSKTIYKFGLA